MLIAEGSSFAPRLGIFNRIGERCPELDPRGVFAGKLRRILPYTDRYANCQL